MSTEPQHPLHRWLNAIALALTLLVLAAWLAQVAFVLRQTKGNDTAIYQKIVLYDALPPGILGGGMLVAAAVVRCRQRVGGTWLFGIGGIVAFSLGVGLTSAVIILIGSSASRHRGEVYLEFATATDLLLGATIISAVVIGGIRWCVDKARRPSQPSLPNATVAAPTGSRPVGRLPDLLSLLVVLLVWFCPVPTTTPLSQVVPLYFAGPSMFVAGFPVGLVGVVALLAAGLLRSGRDRNRLVALELLGVLALAVIFAAAAVPFAADFVGIWVTAAANATWIRGLMLSSWALFASAIAAKLVCVAAGFFRRRERMQFSLLGMLAFIVGCGALAMYWRLWRS